MANMFFPQKYCTREILYYCYFFFQPRPLYQIPPQIWYKCMSMYVMSCCKISKTKKIKYIFNSFLTLLMAWVEEKRWLYTCRWWVRVLIKLYGECSADTNKYLFDVYANSDNLVMYYHPMPNTGILWLTAACGVTVLNLLAKHFTAFPLNP